MEKILLTISIPTFNRANSLSSQLNNIHNILSKNDISQFIEVLVSDNCSTDDTREVVDSIAKLAKTYKLTYNRKQVLN
jgi:glycosyltransferase involved in cell wall biosynthesis